MSGRDKLSSRNEFALNDAPSDDAKNLEGSRVPLCSGVSSSCEYKAYKHLITCNARVFLTNQTTLMVCPLSETEDKVQADWQLD
jgi:hypothetical protein